MIRAATEETYSVVTTLQVNRDDVIRIHTGSGGGYGDPRRRARESVLEDLENGFVAEERARTVYGVELSFSASDRG